MMTLSRWKVLLVVLAAVLGAVFTLPNLLPANVRGQLPGFLPSKGLNLGLDLQGGSYLLYSVDTQALRNERLTNLTEDVRKALTYAQIAFTDLGQVNGRLSVRITDPGQVNKAQNTLRNNVGGPLAGVPGGRDGPCWLGSRSCGRSSRTSSRRSGVRRRSRRICARPIRADRSGICATRRSTRPSTTAEKAA